MDVAGLGELNFIGSSGQHLPAFPPLLPDQSVTSEAPQQTPAPTRRISADLTHDVLQGLPPLIEGTLAPVSVPATTQGPATSAVISPFSPAAAATAPKVPPWSSSMPPLPQIHPPVSSGKRPATRAASTSPTAPTSGRSGKSRKRNGAPHWTKELSPKKDSDIKEHVVSKLKGYCLLVISQRESRPLGINQADNTRREYLTPKLAQIIMDHMSIIEREFSGLPPTYMGFSKSLTNAVNETEIFKRTPELTSNFITVLVKTVIQNSKATIHKIRSRPD